MGILDLPLELVDLIWQHVPYGSLESFALSNKYLQYGGAKRMEQHRDRLEKYRYIDTNPREKEESEYPYTPLNLLRAIEKDCEITQYPRYLNLMVPPTDPDDEEYIAEGWHREKGEDCPWYWSLLSEELRGFAAGDAGISSWKEDLEEGYQSAIFTLLILLLPKLETIEFEQWYQDGLITFPESLTPFLPGRGGYARHLASHTLAKLTHIEASTWSGDNQPSYPDGMGYLINFDGILHPFCTLPSIKNFVGKYMFLEGLAGEELEGVTLQLRTFKCRRSALKLQSLRELLSCSPKLEYFFFEHYGSGYGAHLPVFEDNTITDTRLICELLERHGHMLREYRLYLKHATRVVGSRLEGKWRRLIMKGEDEQEQLTITDVGAAHASEDPPEIYDEFEPVSNS